MEQFMIHYVVTFTDELNNYKEKTDNGFVCAATHSDAVKQIENYYGERHIIEVKVQAWDTQVLIVPESLIETIGKENFM